MGEEPRRGDAKSDKPCSRRWTTDSQHGGHQASDLCSGCNAPHHGETNAACLPPPPLLQRPLGSRGRRVLPPRGRGSRSDIDHERPRRPPRRTPQRAGVASTSPAVTHSGSTDAAAPAPPKLALEAHAARRSTTAPIRQTRDLYRRHDRLHSVAVSVVSAARCSSSVGPAEGARSARGHAVQ
jgi:hypothetical protein